VYNIHRNDTWHELIEGGDPERRSNEDAIMWPRSAKSVNPDTSLVFLILEMDRVAHICANRPAGFRRLSRKRRIYSGNVLICRRPGSRHLSSQHSAAIE